MISTSEIVFEFFRIIKFTFCDHWPQNRVVNFWKQYYRILRINFSGKYVQKLQFCRFLPYYYLKNIEKTRHKHLAKLQFFYGVFYFFFAQKFAQTVKWYFQYIISFHIISIRKKKKEKLALIDFWVLLDENIIDFLPPI